MLFIPGFIQRVTRIFRRKDKEIPTTPQPIPEYEHIEGFDQILAEAHAMNRRLRHGTGDTFIENLTNAQRILEYQGNTPPVGEIPQNKQILVETIIVHPEYGKFEVTFTFRSGEAYDAETEFKYTAGKLKGDIPEGIKHYDLLRGAVIERNYYLRSYRPIPQIG
jgi:hypothetical protein